MDLYYNGTVEVSRAALKIYLFCAAISTLLPNVDKKLIYELLSVVVLKATNMHHMLTNMHHIETEPLPAPPFWLEVMWYYASSTEYNTTGCSCSSDAT